MYTKEKIHVVTAFYEYDGIASETVLGAYRSVSEAFANLRKYDYKSWFTENVNCPITFGELREETYEDGTYRTGAYVYHMEDKESGGSVWLTIAPTTLVGYKF